MWWPRVLAGSAIAQVRVVEAVKVLGLMYLVFIFEVCPTSGAAFLTPQITCEK